MTKVKDGEKLEPKKKMVVVEEVLPQVEDAKLHSKEENLEIESAKVQESQSDVSLENTVETQVDQQESTNYLFIIVPVALLVGALVGGLITYFSGLSKISSTDPTPTPAVTVEPVINSSPSPSPVSSLKKDELKIQILNASGVSGAAGKVKILLNDAGYKSVDTGNASISDLSQTEVSIKDSKKEYLDVIIKDLSKSYDAVESKKALPSSSKYDLVITLGSK